MMRPETQPRAAFAEEIAAPQHYAPLTRCGFDVPESDMPRLRAGACAHRGNDEEVGDPPAAAGSVAGGEELREEVDQVINGDLPVGGRSAAEAGDVGHGEGAAEEVGEVEDDVVDRHLSIGAV